MFVCLLFLCVVLFYLIGVGLILLPWLHTFTLLVYLSSGNPAANDYQVSPGASASQTEAGSPEGEHSTEDRPGASASQREAGSPEGEHSTED